MNRVFILGGGVAGLSAAHELAERGFNVTVFERNAICGGKARSMKFVGSGTGGRQDLPGEHGFRFFPGFYWHIEHTMSRIFLNSSQTQSVFDNLKVASEIGIAQKQKSIFKTTATHPDTLEEWVAALKQLFENPTLGVSLAEARVFLGKLLCFLGASKTRRIEQYEGVSWFDFIEAGTKSEQYRAILARGLSQSLVAMRPDKASTLTVGTMLVQILLNIIQGSKADRVLNAPTNEAWIDPWMAQLTGPPNPVTILTSRTATHLHFDSASNLITHVTITDPLGQAQDFGDDQDYYIAAVPIEVVQNDKTLFPQAFKLAAGLSHLVGTLDTGVDRLETEWMTGLLFYLNRPLTDVNGHVIYAHSNWSLTSVSQAQFWSGYPWSSKGNGQTVDILSTIISNWREKGSETTTEHAINCTRGEIFRETWAQLKTHLTQAPNGPLTDADLVGTLDDQFIDPAITFDTPGPGGKVTGNLEPLLINTTGSRSHRPRAVTLIPNFFVASDYVLTETDLACMEAANEAARHAVNGVLAQAGSPEPPCVIQPLQEPAAFEVFKKADELEYQINPARPPLLCRLVDTLLPPSPGGPLVGPSLSPAVLALLVMQGINLALVAVVLYLLLRN
jgi:uncharacterized protein with NAD-binding domain and iron-sulfur cluster